ncbi:MAG: carbohydrate ABC transporter permease, partial [Halanaerobiales bacterium]
MSLLEEKIKSFFNTKTIKEYDNLAGFIFISPWLIGFISFTIIPMILSLGVSFTRYDVISAPEWIGLKNYIDIFTVDSTFISSIKITFFYTFISVPLRLAFALFLAVLFNQKRKMVGLYRTLFYIPSVIGGSVAVAVMWRQLFGSSGALNSLLNAFFGIDISRSWIRHPQFALWTLIFLAIWQFGSPMLIFLAGLKQIPGSLYEAAIIDGANWGQKFLKITIPMLSPVILFNLIMQIISGFMMFTQAYIITEGGPFDQTLVYVLYLFRRAFS